MRPEGRGGKERKGREGEERRGMRGKKEREEGEREEREMKQYKMQETMRCVHSLFLKVSGIFYPKNEVSQPTIHYYVTQIHVLSPWIRM